MSEELNQTSGQAEGTAPGSTPAVEQQVPPAAQEPAGQQEAKPEFLTRAEAEAWKADVLNQARSYADKGRVRVEKAVQDVTNAIAVLRATGRDISPADEKALKDAAIQKAMVEPETPPPAAQEGEIDPEILAIQKQAGIDLLDADPEVATLVRDKGNYAFYRSLDAALAAKKTRLASQPTVTTPASRLPADGSAPRGFPDTVPASERWKQVKYKK